MSTAAQDYFLLAAGPGSGLPGVSGNRRSDFNPNLPANRRSGFNPDLPAAGPGLDGG